MKVMVWISEKALVHGESGGEEGEKMVVVVVDEGGHGEEGIWSWRRGI